jgi:hypothetical protein
VTSLDQSPPLAAELDSVDQIQAAALAQARRWNLVCANGEIVCLRGCGRAATLPSLCCVSCLAARRGLR